MSQSLMVHNMLTPNVSVAFRPDARVSNIALSDKGHNFAWSESNGIVKQSLNMDDVQEFVADGQITGLEFIGNQLLILDDNFGLRCISSKNESIWECEIPGGASILQTCTEFIAVVDNLGRLFITDYDGHITFEDLPFAGIIMLEIFDGNLIVVQEDGEIHYFDGAKVIWSRPKRGEVGEAITTVGESHDHLLIVVREGYALVPGDEEALEMELWNISENKLFDRIDIRDRIVNIQSNKSRTVLGFDSGSLKELDVSKSDQGYELKELIDCKFPIKQIVISDEKILACSWFYIFGLNIDGTHWKIEHQGMVEFVAYSENNNLCFFAGDDQNDYTETEPIGYFNLDHDLIELDESELTVWFEESNLSPQLTAEQIYSDDEDLRLYLSNDDGDYADKSFNIESEEVDNLLTALEEELLPTINEGSELEILSNTGDIDSEQYDDIDANELLIGELLKESEGFTHPKADAGKDSVFQCKDEEDSTIILLDGSNTYNPNNMVKSWSWVDESGREISTLQKFRAKLGKGNYRFELRVTDVEDNSTSDSVQITVV